MHACDKWKICKSCISLVLSACKTLEECADQKKPNRWILIFLRCNLNNGLVAIVSKKNNSVDCWCLADVTMLRQGAQAHAFKWKQRAAVAATTFRRFMDTLSDIQENAKLQRESCKWIKIKQSEREKIAENISENRSDCVCFAAIRRK